MTIQTLDTKEQFDELLHNVNNLLIVDFYAVWCGPCKRIAPDLEKISNTNTKVTIVKVDVDNNDSISKEYNIKSMPTFLFFKKGKKVGEVVGANLNSINDMIKQHS
jgi:thioredoxin 1